MQYRPHVDGLRALAILFVVFFHAGFKAFSSGYIGVDVFFVISGFLITSIIHHSLQNNQFSFVDFYSRRLWRMQPVLICFLIVTTLISLYLLLPDDFIQFTKSAKKTSLFMSNQYFERVTANYFAQDSMQLPLMNTWSLAIEWQCYFILPLIIYIFYQYFSRDKLIKVFYLSTLLFFALSLYFSFYEPTKTYFQLSSRFYEFLIGSCIAVSAQYFPRNSYVLNGLGLIALSILFYVANQSSLGFGYPNYYALLVCLATAMLIVIGEQRPSSYATRFLSLRPLVFIGLISYSLYIWHWPVFAFLRYLAVEETGFVLSLAFIAIVMISWVSWRYIEKPARKLHTSKFGYSLICLFLAPLVITNIASFINKKGEGYPERFPNFYDALVQLKKYTSKARTNCLVLNEEKNVAVSKECKLGAENPNSKRAFMFGDSFSNHHWRFMEPLAEAANISITAHAYASCLALPGIYQRDWITGGDIYSECHKQIKRYYSMVKNNHYDYVILGQNWSGYLSRGNVVNHLNDERSYELKLKRIETALDKALQIIIAAGSRPIIIKSIALNDFTYTCFYKNIKRRTKPENCDFVFQPQDQAWFDNLFAKMQKKYKQIIFIDPKTVQCPKGVCKAMIDDVPVFYYPAHLSDYSSYRLGELYLQKFQNPFVA